ncbi:MAG: transglutaminase-like domain-containing protein [Bacteroidota bacterium]
MVKVSELKALISLLDDPDGDIYNQVRDQLLSYGEEAIPELENLWEFSHFEPFFQDRILDIVHQIQFNAVKTGFEEWAKNDADLLEGAYLINKYQYPESTKKGLEKEIDRISRTIWLELNPNLTAFETVRVFNYVLFTILGFKANKTNYHSPQNSFMSDVLESKKGNPLSLAMVFQLVAEKLGVPIKGVNLPNHFILAYLDIHQTNFFLDAGDEEVLFYINPFSNGAIVNRQEIEQFLTQLKLEQEPEYFVPCSNRAMVRRMLNNLIYSYARQGYEDKVAELKILEAILSVEN